MKKHVKAGIRNTEYGLQLPYLWLEEELRRGIRSSAGRWKTHGYRQGQGTQRICSLTPHFLTLGIRSSTPLDLGMVKLEGVEAKVLAFCWTVEKQCAGRARTQRMRPSTISVPYSILYSLLKN